MRIGSLFSGIGGLELGLEWAGLGYTVWQVEQSAFCRSILARHWPDAERFEDVKTVGGENLGEVDLICGGFPCQDLSGAGKGAGLTGDRSGLWFEFARIVQEMRPSWVIVENVASGADKWVDTVAACLAELEYETLPIPLSAADVGAPHIRKRVFIVARNTNKDSKSMVTVNEKASRVPGGAGIVPRWEEPPSIRVDDGIPGGMGAFGNAVVPQCAEVIGYVVRELMEMEE
jgi:DNA (cytosine-5)-methyltransferase 1